MAERQIPDRSDEPAVQESLDREKSTTAANSNEVEPHAPPEARDDEGNAVVVQRKVNKAETRVKPDSDAGSQ